MSAPLVAAPEVSWSNSCADTALESSSFFARASSDVASAARERAAVSCDWARASSAWNGFGSMVNSIAPCATRAPSLKCTLSIVPPMRGRTSTERGASSRPVNSSMSVTVRCTAAATETGGAPGGPPGWPSGLEQPAISKRPSTAALKNTGSADREAAMVMERLQ